MQTRIAFNQLNTALTPHINLNGQRYLYFGGTAYLGIPTNQDFIDLYLQGVQQFGLNNGTSRSNNIQLGIYDEVEADAAAYFRAESALITSSGFLAAQFIIKYFAERGEIRYAPATHPALWQAESPNVTGSFIDWSTKIVAEINQSRQQKWVLISNSMNNLYPEIYDFGFIREIDSRKEIILVVDDSHGIGINNEGLSALSAIPQTSNVKVLVIASMAKSLGVDAGIVLGPNKLIAKLKKEQGFLGASPPAAAGLFAFSKATEIYQTELKKLKNISRKLALALANKSEWHFVPDFPVFLSKKEDLKVRLLENNILISSFPYPTQDGQLINRIVLNSGHSEADLNQLIAVI